MAKRIGFRDIANELRQEIAAGTYDRPDAAFPSATELAERFDSTRPTVDRALRLLADDGVLSIGRGRRAVVLHADLRETAWPITRRYAKARAARGLIFGTSVTGRMRKETIGRWWAVPAEPIRELLGTGPRTKVLHRRSRTYIDGRPLEDTTMHFPKAIVDAVPAFDEPGDISVVSMIEATGRTIEKTANAITFHPATDDQAEALSIGTGATVVVWTHGTYTADGEAVEAVINIKPTAGTKLTFETYEGNDI